MIHADQTGLRRQEVDDRTSTGAPSWSSYALDRLVHDARLPDLPP
jgi:hypothetical protein